jgi:4'-phosphopantetheinyl transferase
MTRSDDILYPVILPVPTADQARKGRAKVQALSRHARLALQRSCEKSGLVLDELPKDNQGVPLPVNGVHWSLSHKSAIVGGVAAPLPVGLDLETLRPVRSGLFNKVADGTEWRLAGEKDEKMFFRVWTAKEAVLKAVGKGMAGLSRCRIVEIENDCRMTLTYDDSPWPVEHFLSGRHLAAITAYRFIVDWSFIVASSFSADR